MVETWLGASLALLGGYLIGSIPFGVLVTRFAGAGDLRTIGSGNIGATNVLRTGRKGLALATLLLDMAKGAVAVLIAGWASPELAPIAGIAAFLGHLYPVWLRFHGGKGVATMLGIALALLWPAGVAFAAVWLGRRDGGGAGGARRRRAGGGVRAGAAVPGVRAAGAVEASRQSGTAAGRDRAADRRRPGQRAWLTGPARASATPTSPGSA